MGRVVTEKGILRIRKQARADRKKVVFTNGCFDILHRGHVQYLKDAKKLGDILVVGVNSDPSVRRIKGKERPIVPLEDRMAVLASLQSVDYVVSFDEDTPGRLMAELIPDVLVKGGDWAKDTIVGRDVVEKNGGKVVVISFLRGYSTRGIIAKIKRAYSKRR